MTETATPKVGEIWTHPRQEHPIIAYEEEGSDGSTWTFATIDGMCTVLVKDCTRLTPTPAAPAGTVIAYVPDEMHEYGLAVDEFETGIPDVDEWFERYRQLNTPKPPPLEPGEWAMGPGVQKRWWFLARRGVLGGFNAITFGADIDAFEIHVSNPEALDRINPGDVPHECRKQAVNIMVELANATQ